MKPAGQSPPAALPAAASPVAAPEAPEACGAVVSPRAAELAAAGWERQFIGSEPRLAEVVALYRELGREVRLEPVGPAEAPAGDGCAECFAGCELRAVWTRTVAAEK